MHERIKALRKALGLTQQGFAERLGSVQNTIAGYETGRRAPSNQVITLICREFEVNEGWLRHGEGEMFLPQTEDERLAQFMGAVLKGGERTFQRRFMMLLSALEPEEWALLERIVGKLHGEESA